MYRTIHDLARTEHPKDTHIPAPPRTARCYEDTHSRARYQDTHSPALRSTAGRAAGRARHEDTHKNAPWRALGLTLACATLTQLAAVPSFAAGTGPAIRLFPTTVLEDIRQTGIVAEEMESGLQGVISKLDQQQQLFLESKCEGAEGDPGCERIARNLGATYLEMLNVMADRLPDMERAVDGTRASLEKRLRAELGRKMTPWQLQETLLGNAPNGTVKAEPRMRGRSGLRLSERFQQYYTLVAQTGKSEDNSLAVVASDIYLDMVETAQLIAHTQEEIGRATLLEQLNQSFGLITPEMQEVVAGVKSILFGELDQTTIVAGPPPGSEETVYRSPLEM